MAFIDYFQATRCPACKTMLKAKTLGPAKLFTNQPVPAGQCHECKADLQWVRSWQRGLVMAVVGTVGVILGVLLVAMITGKVVLRLSMILGAAVAFGFLSAKKLAIAPVAQPSDE